MQLIQSNVECPCPPPIAPKYIWTWTGKRLAVEDPQPEDISILDIARGLVLVPRFGGQTRFPYTVAQHSLAVAEHVKEEYKLSGILHDSAEGYYGDIVSPVKHNIPAYMDIEDKLMRVIADKYGFIWPLPVNVKAVDNRMYNTEAMQLQPAGNEADPKGSYKGMVLHYMPWEDQEKMFLFVFSQLYGG